MHTIITVCWGDYWERYGKRWSEAALAITCKPEIIVVSDKPIYTQFKVVYNDSKHAGLARNSGIQVATGEYVSCSDIDDIPYPHYFDGVDGEHDIIGFALDIEGGGSMNPDSYTSSSTWLPDISTAVHLAHLLQLTQELSRRKYGKWKDKVSGDS